MKALLIVVGLFACGWFARDFVAINYTSAKASAQEALPTVHVTPTPIAASAWHKAQATANEVISK